MNTITKFLDDYLTRRTSIAPVEANELLEKAGLLLDSKDRAGKPLRDLLRKGKLPHAFQLGDKGSAWTIPLSTKRTNVSSNYPKEKSQVNKPTTIKAKEKVSAKVDIW